MKTPLACRFGRHRWESLLYLGLLSQVERLGVRIPKPALPYMEVCARCLITRDTRENRQEEED